MYSRLASLSLQELQAERSRLKAEKPGAMASLTSEELEKERVGLEALMPGIASLTWEELETERLRLEAEMPNIVRQNDRIELSIFLKESGLIKEFNKYKMRLDNYSVPFLRDMINKCPDKFTIEKEKLIHVYLEQRHQRETYVKFLSNLQIFAMQEENTLEILRITKTESESEYSRRFIGLKNIEKMQELMKLNKLEKVSKSENKNKEEPTIPSYLKNIIDTSKVLNDDERLQKERSDRAFDNKRRKVELEARRQRRKELRAMNKNKPLQAEDDDQKILNNITLINYKNEKSLLERFTLFFNPRKSTSQVQNEPSVFQRISFWFRIKFYEMKTHRNPKKVNHPDNSIELQPPKPKKPSP